MMKKLRVLYISHNLIKDWFELRRLVNQIDRLLFSLISFQSAIFTLNELVFVGNPLQDEWKGETSWIDSVQETLKNVIK
jgi:hypothetical protein